MHRKIFARLAPLTVVLMLAGCSSSDEIASGDPDDITEQEMAEGNAWSPTEASEHGGESESGEVGPESGLTISTPEEDSRDFIDESEAMNPAEPRVPAVLDPEDAAATSTCRRANGYRSGRKFTICVTTIDGKYVEVNTARAYLRMRRAARNVGVYLKVVSGFRTMAEQRYLYNCYKTKRCNGGNLAAPPGYSNHQSGHALDLNTSSRGVYSFLANRGRSFGFRRTVPSENWHWEH
jgi:hypothetical protein